VPLIVVVVVTASLHHRVCYGCYPLTAAFFLTLRNTTVGPHTFTHIPPYLLHATRNTHYTLRLVCCFTLQCWTLHTPAARHTPPHTPTNGHTPPTLTFSHAAVDRCALPLYGYACLVRTFIHTHATAERWRRWCGRSAPHRAHPFTPVCLPAFHHGCLRLTLCPR